MTKKLHRLAQHLGNILLEHDVTLAVAESCTGGWIAKICTEIPGSSAWFDRGFVTYSNAAKIEMLAVNADTVEHYGAVSEQTAIEMVRGVLAHSNADIAIAVTGIAGPSGGNMHHPIGTVYIAWQKQGEDVQLIKKQFHGTRHRIRAQTVKTALNECVENRDLYFPRIHKNN